MIELHNVDCMEFLKGQPDKAFDLAIVDPPYGIGEDGGTNHTRGVLCKSKAFVSKGWDVSAPDSDYFKELRRVSSNQIVWGANHYIDRLPYGSPCWIVWDKDNGANDFADCELAYTSFPTAVRRFRFKWHGMLQEDMANKEIRIHPTQKPVALYRWLLKNYAKPGQKILDTHGGSMSIAIACDIEGYDLTLCELDPDYFAAGKKRLEQHQAQPRLFDAPAPQPIQLTL